MLIGQLLKPYSYLTIRHPYKWVVDWLYPGLLAVATMATLVSTGNIQTAMDPEGAVSMLLFFIQSLPGFYIAALAAIATFGRADIDSILPEPTPRIKIRFRNTDNLVALTRRRFLAMLFAFLTAESITLVLFSVFLVSYSGDIANLNVNEYPLGEWLIAAMGLGYFVALFQMLIVTFWGLYYLGHKLHE